MALLREREKLCKSFNLVGIKNFFAQESRSSSSDDEDESSISIEVLKGEFEVEKLVGICYGGPSNIGKVGLKFKVRWKGYCPSEDTREPIDGLSTVEDIIIKELSHNPKKIYDPRSVYLSEEKK